MSGDDSAALLTASIRSFLDGGDASEARLRALLLDDLGASGRGSRELVDAAVRAYGLGIVSGVDRRMVRSTLNAEFGLVTAADVLGAWDAATGSTSAVSDGVRSGVDTRAMVAVGAVAVAAFAFVVAFYPFGGGSDVGSDVDGSPTAITTRPPPPGGASARDIADAWLRGGATTAAVTTTTVGTSTDLVSLAELFPFTDFTKCEPRDPPGGWPVAGETQSCVFVMTEDGMWRYGADVDARAELVLAAYTHEFSVFPDQEQFDEVLDLFGSGRDNTTTWSSETSSGVYSDVWAIRHDGSMVNGVMWTYDNMSALAVVSRFDQWPGVDNNSEYLELFLDVVAPWS